MRRLGGAVRQLLHVVTPVGSGLISVAVAAALAAHQFGGQGMAVISALAISLLALGLVVIALPSRTDATVVLQPLRTSVGVPVRGFVRVRHRGPFPVFSGAALFPVPGGVRRLPVGLLWPGTRHREAFTLPARRRGVFEVGPVALERHDPFGLVRWRRPSGTASHLYVRPRTVPLTSFGAGSLRDIEGVASDRISMSDLAFHALREYVRGDDLRHVHWRSSARAGQLLVRQYQDTRRTKASVVVDSQRSAYGSPEEFELALSVAASMAVRGIQDDLELAFFCGPERVVNCDTDQMLDACCRAEMGEEDLAATMSHAVTEAPDTSLLLLVTGSARDDHELAAAAMRLGLDAQQFAVRCEPGSEPVIGAHGGLGWGRVGSLRHLPGLMSHFQGELR